MSTKVDREQALEIARQDALRTYRDLSVFKVEIQLRKGNWEIDYDLQNGGSQGGGPQYVISAETGDIVSKLYEQ